MIIKSKPDDFLNWLIRHRDAFAFIQGRLIDIKRGESAHTAIVTGFRITRENVVTLVVTPLGDNLEIGWSAGQWGDLSSEFLDRLRDEIKKVWPTAYNDFVCYSADVISEAQPVKSDPVTMWNDTADKLERLKIIRRDYMTSHNGEILTWTSACGLAGIDPKTANTHAKELKKNWKNREYREL